MITPNHFILITAHDECINRPVTIRACYEKRAHFQPINDANDFQQVMFCNLKKLNNMQSVAGISYKNTNL